MASVGHFFGWGVIVQIAAIVHWSRKRPATYWLFIIIFFGFLGALAYFLVEGIDFDAMGKSIRGPSRRRRIHALQALIRDNPSAGNYEELGELPEGMLARRATMPAYQKRRDRTFLRRAGKLLRRIRGMQNAECRIQN